ncbi:MAG: OmpH family outer membrane protein [Candidatus Rokubacteria bacterium]|nr:OmpH family outer membrane protein [Candidatus Rokubacteria bacterium]MBI3827759.1 OmpH family outer membrane protein [Candidatus Rokubacteria bacterium]
MKRSLSAFVLVGVTVVAATAGAQPLAPPVAGRVVVVDVQRVLARSAAGVAAREQLERERAGMQKEMDGRRNDIEKLGEELQKKGALMTPDVRREKTDLFERKRRDAARLAEDFQKDLQKKEDVASQKVLQEIFNVIERVGKERGYYMMVERQGSRVLYAVEAADATEEIIRAYDQQSGARPAVTPAPAPKKP